MLELEWKRMVFALHSAGKSSCRSGAQTPAEATVRKDSISRKGLSCGMFGSRYEYFKLCLEDDVDLVVDGRMALR